MTTNHDVVSYLFYKLIISFAPSIIFVPSKRLLIIQLLFILFQYRKQGPKVIR